MPKVLRFGISSLDELLGTHPTLAREGVAQGEAFVKPPAGIYLPTKEENITAEETNGADKEVFTTSLCIIGPNGAGKSIFGLHMASTYLADCAAAREKLPAVLYISTDFTFNMAQRVWSDFGLDRPFSRKDPFGPPGMPPATKRDLTIDLKKCKPTNLAENFDILEKDRGGVVFVDIASYTAGDDWGFVHKLLSLLSTPGEDNPRHLVVLDAIEGFEALAGDLNAFGEKSTRRSRVAQVMRLIAGKCHALLVVEEGKKHERLAEEFVADTVIKLENLSTRNYERRVLKVEKVRGQSHIRGQHHYSIRSGYGSTTGLQINPDDPEVSASKTDDAVKQSYIQTFHSVHRLNRKIMEMRGKARKELEANAYYAAFDIKYLDNMLGGREKTTERIPTKIEGETYYCDTRGLPCSSTTALIGDSLTQKSALGKAFLSRCFHSFDVRLRASRELLKQAGGEADAEQIWKLLYQKMQLLSDSPRAARRSWKEKGKELIKSASWDELLKYAVRDGLSQLPFPLKGSARERLTYLIGEKQSIRHLNNKQVHNLLEEARLTHLAAWLLDYQAGVAVMLATHNTHYEKLARDFIGWLHKEGELKDLNSTMTGYKQALENYIKGGTLCRRLEIHSMSSEILIHIVQQVIISAQRRILTLREMQSIETRYEKSWPIRVVIDDFSTFRDIFPELREDPLLLPSILFHFEREGVTTLIVDTQSGKPETPIAERFESELRQMVQHNLYTWRVPFYGESRVAITAIPPLSYEYAGIVRELRWESETLNQQNPSVVSEPPTVDPHFELYTGLEEGKPQPVPLHVRFYAETPAMEAYMAMENNFLNERFIPHAHTSQTGEPSVIVGVPAANYDELRDFAYLQRDTRLDHALVFQVDEFWAMRPPGRRKRAGSFQPQWSYLNAITAEAPEADKNYEPDPNVDAYKLFQRRESDPPPQNNESLKLRRRHFYEKYYEDFPDYQKFDENQKEDEYLIDRVPFSWDFGFLLCQEKAWEDNERSFEVKGKTESESKSWTVRKVWESLIKAKEKPASKETINNETDPREDRHGAERQQSNAEQQQPNHVSWRVFTEACKKVAERQSDKLAKPVTAFDFAQISPESFSCLILEMWFSEIFVSLQRQKEEAATPNEKSKVEDKLNKLLEVSKRHLFVPAYDGSSKPALRLSELLDKYWLELYKCWMLLIEVINFSDIVGEATALNFDFKSKNTDFSAIASRHWYKTASQCPDEIAGKAPLVAVRLPGHFSVRGDWFLAVSGNSRSIRQAERALDLLNSRRANVTRLQLGIGLPTRSPKEKSGADSSGQRSSLGMLRTKLITHEWGQDNVEYETFLKIAALSHEAQNANKGSGENDFHWLWRSSLGNYAHYNRIWHKWLNRTLLWWHRKLLRYKSVWINSFKIYDNLTIAPPRTRKDFAPQMSEIDKHRKAKKTERDNFLKKYRVESLAQLIVRRNYLKLVEVLEEELKQAYEANYNSRQD